MRIHLLVCLLSISLLSGCSTVTPLPDVEWGTYRHTALSALIQITEQQLKSTEAQLTLVAESRSARSGRWRQIRKMMAGVESSRPAKLLWYVRPDGSYFTTDAGLVDKNLSDRAYFPRLMAGEVVIGDLVVSKSTGRKSAIVAVPIKEKGKVVGGIGASVYLDPLSEKLSDSLALPEDTTFYALSPSGETSLNSVLDRNMVDPRAAGSKSLAQATDLMLANPSGLVKYELNGEVKQAYFMRGEPSGWVYAIARVVRKEK